MFDEIEKAFLGGLGAEKRAGLFICVDMGDLGQEIEMVAILAGKEKK